MGLKKRSRVNAEFNMSSLTDIIFLLLIFFMLTSSLVAPNALNLKLPGKNTNMPSANKQIDDVRIDKRGRFYYNGKRQSFTEVQNRVKRNKRSGDGTITISPDSGTPVEAVAQVMDLALRLNVDAILATELK